LLTSSSLQLHNSYSSLGKDYKSVFEDLVKHITAQRSEADSLRRELQSAMNTMALQNASLSTRVQEALEEERRQTAEDRQKLMSQVANLINSQADAQEARLADRATLIQKTLTESNSSMETAMSQYTQGMSNWDSREDGLMEEVKKSREQLKTKLKDDWTVASDQSTSIQNMAKSIHAETARVAEEQTDDLDTQMEALDDFVGRAKSENASHHESHGQSLQTLSNTVEQSFGNISAHFKTTFERVKNLGEGMELDTNDLRDGLEPLESQICQPLANLREGITSTGLQEYQPTGDTPQKAAYFFPTKLPRTEAHDMIIAKIDEEPSAITGDGSVDKDDASVVFPDIGHKSSPITATRQSHGGLSDKNMSLREVNPNVTTTLNLTTGGVLGFDPRASTMSMPPEHTMPSFKKPLRGARGGVKKQPVLAEGRENMLVGLEQSLSRRKSPRLN
jgi:kinesin family protein 11